MESDPISLPSFRVFSWLMFFRTRLRSLLSRTLVVGLGYCAEEEEEEVVVEDDAAGWFRMMGSVAGSLMACPKGSLVVE